MGSGIKQFNDTVTTSVTLAGSGTPTVATNPTTVLSVGISVVTTVATTGDGALLPAGTGKGNEVWVVNQTANTIDVFPNAGGTINGGTASTGQVGVVGKGGATFVQTGTDGLTWYSKGTIAAVS